MQGGRLIGATCGIIGNKNGWALIGVWALNRDNTVHNKNMQENMSCDQAQ